MEYLLNAQQMRQHEEYMMDTMGMESIVLMERAALSVAETVVENLWEDEKAFIVCGNGNNGADGVAVARILAEQGYPVDVLLLNGEEGSELYQKQVKLLKNLSSLESGIRIFHNLTDTYMYIGEYAVIVDAILGIGANRELTGVYKEAVGFMNQFAVQKIAIDVPTGVCSDSGKILGTAFEADITVTFGFKKLGHVIGEGQIYSGAVRVESCGMGYARLLKEKGVAFVLDKKTVRKYLKRNSLGNKSTFGKLGIIAGNEMMAGAALLNVCAAFRTGAGYIRLFTHEVNRDVVLSALPETVLELYGKDTVEEYVEKIKKLVGASDVILAGSGIGKSEASRLSLAMLSHEMTENKVLILDADALNLLAEDEMLQKQMDKVPATVIITPHILEFARLIKQPVSRIKEDRFYLAREYAKQHNCIVVLKDAQTIITAPDGKLCVCVKGNDGMAVAGSGDVLAGIIASICGQIKKPYISACIGVYIHAMAGKKAAQKKGKHSMMPTDMVHALVKCMKKLGKEETDDDM